MNIGEIAKILGLISAVVALAEIARRTKLPYPTLMVVAGILIGLVPGLPKVELQPELVFLVFLPPILYSAAWNTWLQDFRRHLAPISLLAVGLVLLTCVAVAQVCVLIIPGMSWWHGFLLGAIVSPPDAAAATAICQRLGVGRKIVTVLEGESLVNDASGLMAYRVALVAILQGSFSPVAAAGQLVFAAVGGVCIGLLAGVIISQVHKRVRDPIVTTAISLLAPYVAYLPAEAFHVSGVLAAVAAGLYVSKQSPILFSPQARLQAVHVWELLILLINGVLFVLIGLQLDSVLTALSNVYAPLQLLWYAGAVCTVVIVLRLAWVYPMSRVSRLLTPSPLRSPAASWQQLTVVGWTGMRGIVSLAAAMALPQFVVAGADPPIPFAFRDLIIFLTVSVIFATLVLQSLTLAPLIARLGESVKDSVAHEELVARMITSNAALFRLEKHSTAGPDAAVITRVRAEYFDRVEAATAHAAEGDEMKSDGSGAGMTFRRGRLRAEDAIRREAIAAERGALIALRDAGEVSEDVFRRIEHDLDLDESRVSEI